MEQNQISLYAHAIELAKPFLRHVPVGEARTMYVPPAVCLLKREAGRFIVVVIEMFREDAHAHLVGSVSRVKTLCVDCGVAAAELRHQIDLSLTAPRASA